MSKSFETARSGKGISEEIAKAAMSSTPSGLYEFGPFRLDLERHLLSRAGQSLPLPPKAFELLLVLVQSPGRAFSKRELMSAALGRYLRRGGEPLVSDFCSAEGARR